MALITQKLNNVWTDIEKQLLRLYPEYANEPSFLPPIDEKEIREFERTLAVTLPPEYRNSLKVHEGTAPAVWLWNAVSVSPLEVVKEDHLQYLAEASHSSMDGITLKSVGAVNEKLFDLKWIPVASDNGIPICLDLNPSHGGTIGQIIYVDWEDRSIKVIANNFVDFLEQGLRKMQADS